MYNNNQNCGCNNNNNPQSMNCGWNNNTQCSNCGYYNNNSTQCVNCGYNPLVHPAAPVPNMSCRCDPKAIEASSKMNDLLIQMNVVNLIPEKIIDSFNSASQIAESLSNDIFISTRIDENSIASNFDQLALAAVKVNNYYNRAVEQLMRGYECCSRQQDQNASCWYTTQGDCKQYIDQITTLKEQIIPKAALLEQTIASTENLSIAVSQAQATVTANALATSQPLTYSFTIVDDRVKNLSTSFGYKQQAYKCCKTDATDTTCCDTTGVCDCKDLFTQSKNLSDIEALLLLIYNQQQSLYTTNVAAFADAVNKEVVASNYLYAAMAQVADVADQINVLWQQIYDLALKAFNCCQESNHSGSCCSPNCDTFLKVATELQDKAIEQYKIATDANTRMVALVEIVKASKVKEQKYITDLQTMATDYFTQSSALITQMNTDALPMMDEAYKCCSNI